MTNRYTAEQALVEIDDVLKQYLAPAGISKADALDQIGPIVNRYFVLRASKSHAATPEFAEAVSNCRTAIAAASTFDVLAHLQRQREFSGRTFGPGPRTNMVIDHIRKELREIEANPTDVREWIDVVILGLDGAWRTGATPQQIIDALVAKQARNEGRTWPDWRTSDPDRAIEHDRAIEEEAQPDGHAAAIAENRAVMRWQGEGRTAEEFRAYRAGYRTHRAHAVDAARADWHTMNPDKAIEHDRGSLPLARPGRWRDGDDAMDGAGNASQTTAQEEPRTARLIRNILRGRELWLRADRFEVVASIVAAELLGQAREDDVREVEYILRKHFSIDAARCAGEGTHDPIAVDHGEGDAR